jgi:small subunit ribosomal protein S7
MKNGKKSSINKISKQLLQNIKLKGENPYLVVYNAINNIKPLFDIKIVRRGKRNIIEKPVLLLHENKKNAIAINWLILSAKQGKSNNFCSSLTEVLLEASINEGEAKNKQKELHKKVLVNRSRFFI